MKTIREKENAVFEQWRNDIVQDRRMTAESARHLFICDGVADEQKWQSARRKVIFLLKETNDCDESFDERDYLCEYSDKNCEGRHEFNRTMNGVIPMAYGMLHFGYEDEITDWKIIKEHVSDKAVQHEVLSSIGIANVKKITGGSHATKKLEEFVQWKKNRIRLLEQLEVYAESTSENVYIICGGTEWLLTVYFKDNRYDEESENKYDFSHEKWIMASNGVEYRKIGNLVFIGMAHPAAYVRKNYDYYMIRSVILELESKERKVC